MRIGNAESKGKSGQQLTNKQFYLTKTRKAIDIHWGERERERETRCGFMISVISLCLCFDC